jgi:hemerythrin-like domain-containing protein
MDAITLLKQDHRKVEDLFKQFEGLGERAHKSRANIVKQVILELKVHTQIEEEIFYPAFKKEAEEKDLVLEAIEEHNVAKFVIRSLLEIDETDETFDAKVTVLSELIDHHVKEEEKEMFPQAKQLFDKDRLTELGDKMLALKERLMANAPDISITMVRELPVESHQEL